MSTEPKTGQQWRDYAADAAQPTVKELDELLPLQQRAEYAYDADSYSIRSTQPFGQRRPFVYPNPDVFPYGTPEREAELARIRRAIEPARHVFLRAGVDLAAPGADSDFTYCPPADANEPRYRGLAFGNEYAVNSGTSRERSPDHSLRNLALFVCGLLYGVICGYALNAILEALQ